MAAGAGQAGVAIVTGAGAGIGAAVAARLAAEGRTLLLCDLREIPPDRIAALAGAAGIERLAGDIAAPGFLASLEAALAGRPIAALVHCAAVSASMAAPSRILEVDLGATLALVAFAEPHMAPGAAAVLVASSAGHYLGDRLDGAIRSVTAPRAVASLEPHAPTPQAAYSVSKRGVQLLAVSRAAAFGRRGARIVSLSPGIIDTGMGRAEAAADAGIPAIVAAGALVRLGEADEVAAAAAFLCSPAASFVTGCDLQVDGGQIADFRERGPAWIARDAAAG